MLTEQDWVSDMRISRNFETSPWVEAVEIRSLVPLRPAGDFAAATRGLEGAPLPCLAWCDGPIPNPREIPPRREMQARPHWWPRPQPEGKPSYKTRAWREEEANRKAR
jgi:hypothetical protein